MEERQKVEELLNDYGFSRSQVASAVGLSYSQLSSWLKDSFEPEIGTLESSKKFYDMVSSLYFMNVAANNLYTKPNMTSWFESPIDLGEGYNITPWTIYDNNDHATAYVHFGQIIVHQLAHQDFTHVIDLALPGWRETKSDWKAVVMDDGNVSLQLR